MCKSTDYFLMETIAQLGLALFVGSHLFSCILKYQIKKIQKIKNSGDAFYCLKLVHNLSNILEMDI